ncbi:MAG: ubiquitin-specific protease doa4 [Trizodia sp. TS-e1964]|nr:MAG: ubiquitin-specific protease doa4 [Trizodia sp. TS-e1964]
MTIRESPDLSNSPLDTSTLLSTAMNLSPQTASDKPPVQYAHLEDLVAWSRGGLDINQPLKSLVERAQSSAKQARISLDLRRLDRAYADFLTCSAIVVCLIPQHKDFPSLASNRTEFLKWCELKKEIIARQDTFDKVKLIIMRNNAQLGTLSTAMPLVETATNKGHQPSLFMATIDGDDSYKLVNAQPLGTLAPFNNPSSSVESNRSRPIEPGNIHGPHPPTNPAGQSPTSQDQLLERFANLRAPQVSSLSLQNSTPAKLLQTTPTPPHNSVNSSKSELPLSSSPFQTIGRPSYNTETLPAKDSEIRMPRAPSPAYDPARNIPAISNMQVTRPATRIISKNIALAGFNGVQRTTKGPKTFLPNDANLDKTESTPVTIPRETTISAQDLYKYIEMGYGRVRVLLVDLRTRAEFDEGHIFSNYIICIEPIVLQPDMSAEALEAKLVLSPENEQKLFASREKFDLVVYYDQSSTFNGFLAGPSIKKEQNILRAFNQAVYEHSFVKNLQRPPVLLKGGLDAWVDLLGSQALKPSQTAPELDLIAYLPSYNMAKSTPSIETLRPRNFIWQKPGASPFSRTYDEFMRQPPKTQESMVGPTLAASIRPPSRPPPALPRKSYGGVSDSLSMPPRPMVHLQTSASNPRADNNAVLHQTGLKNNANICYLNATVQILGATKSLASYLIGNRFSSKLRDDRSYPGSNGIVVLHLRKLLKELWESKSSSISSKAFHRICGPILDEVFKVVLPFSNPNNQQDAGEFLGFLLETLHADLNPYEHIEVNIALSEKNKAVLQRLPIQIASAVEWGRFKLRNNSCITQLFTGQQLERYRCLQCGATKSNYVNFTTLALPLPDEAPPKLENYLDEHFKEETLSQPNWWQCSQCKRTTPSCRKVTLTRPPYILVILLSRFQALIRNHVCLSRKITKDIEIPMVDLNMDSYAAPRFELADRAKFLEKHPRTVFPSELDDYSTSLPYTYDAYGFINHVGSDPRNGHYTAYTRSHPKDENHPFGQWVHINDSQCSQVPPKQKIGASAYILFFVRNNLEDPTL